MNMLQDFGKRPDGQRGMHPAARLVMAGAAALALLLGAAVAAHGQVTPSGDAGGLTISAGATGSGFYLQYGERKMVGLTGFVDVDSRSPFGLEFEGRWLEWKQTANVHAETYSAGPRYHRNIGKFQPYAKGMAGFGEFAFPYGLAQGHYFVATAGGGLDYHIRHRIYIRAADIEYQYWPQFTYGGMSSFGVSAGIRVRVF
jgi:hypothetical protein